jgi:hypothetical protein
VVDEVRRWLLAISPVPADDKRVSPYGDLLPTAALKSKELSMNIEEVVDRESIRHVLWTCCRAADRRDEALMHSVYWEDARENHGSFIGSAHDFVTSVLKSPGYTVSQHHLGYIVIDLDGDAARVESDLICNLPRMLDEKMDLDVAGGRYLDIFERRKGEWKIADRTFVMDWTAHLPRLEVPEQLAAFTLRGTQDFTDPSYSLGSV